MGFLNSIIHLCGIRYHMMIDNVRENNIGYDFGSFLIKQKI